MLASCGMPGKGTYPEAIDFIFDPSACFTSIGGGAGVRGRRTERCAEERYMPLAPESANAEQVVDGVGKGRGGVG